MSGSLRVCASQLARAVFPIVLSSMLSAIALAQSTGTIRGTVTDVTGAVMPNATVTITNQATGENHVLKTDSAGVYLLPSMSPGNYKVQVEAPGMQTVVANNLLVVVSSITTQNFAVKVASEVTTVEIQATAPVVESSSVSVGSVVNQRTVQEIP